MIKGKLPIVTNAAEEITADPISVRALLWNPSASTSAFALYDNQDNLIAEANLTVQTPFFIPFPEDIPCSGLSLKVCTAGTLMIYQGNI